MAEALLPKPQGLGLLVATAAAVTLPPPPLGKWSSMSRDRDRLPPPPQPQRLLWAAGRCPVRGRRGSAVESTLRWPPRPSGSLARRPEAANPPLRTLKAESQWEVVWGKARMGESSQLKVRGGPEMKCKL